MVNQSTFNERDYLYFYISIVLLSISAALVSSYLSLSHFWIYTDPTYSSFCAISRAINCDTVAQSPWSVFLGLPLAYWGLTGYLLFMLLLVPVRPKEHPPLFLWVLIVILAGLFSLVSIYFSYISATRIHSYCILCLICFAINLLLFCLCWLLRRRIGSETFLRDVRASFHYLTRSKALLISFGMIFFLFINLQIFVPHYWLLETPPPSIGLPTGVTAEGHPWIGAESPKVVIEEFSDYQCFQCAKSHMMLRQLVEEHPKSIRLVHRHYPMDHEYNPLVVTEPFHVGSGKMSILAIYAMTKGKFWEMNDVLFELGRSKKSFDTVLLEKRTGIPSAELAAALGHPVFAKQLSRDILAGLKYRVLATPTFVIDGNVYTGTIPPDVLTAIIKTSE